MPALREPGLGPIVGHVTDTSCRVWIRGDETGDEGAALDSERRTLGVATILEVPKADRAKLRTDEGMREVRDSLVGQVKAELQKATDGKIGRASWGERGCQAGWFSGVAVTLQKKKKNTQ